MKTETVGKWSTKKKIFISVGIVMAVVLLVIAMDSRLLVCSYVLESDAVDAPVRIALVTDLHSCRYGDKQAELIEAIQRENPDVILMSGDIFDDQKDDTNTDLFLAGLAGKYPMYYVTGNHEYRSGEDAFLNKMAILEKHSVTVLSDVSVTVEVGDQTLTLCGVNDPAVTKRMPDAGPYTARLDLVKPIEDADTFTVLLAHRPEYFEAYAARDFDLVLCGHAHGGQWRIPYLLNGLLAPNQGFFPKYAGGLYEQDGTTMIVSRGLARETTLVPRIFNRPELVIIEIQ